MNTQTLVLKRHAHGPFLITNNKVYSNVSGVNTQEGMGIDADDLSGPATIARNEVFSNQGNGIQVFYGESVSIFSNLSYLNTRTGIYIYACSTCAVSGNDSWGNGDLGLYDGGLVSVGVTAYNNILAYNTTRGGSVTNGTAAAAGFGSGGNVTFANVNNNGCANLTCPYTADPLTRAKSNTPTSKEDFKLRPDSPYKCSGSTAVGRMQDKLGRFYEPNCTPVGAYMYGGGDAAPARSAAP